MGRVSREVAVWLPERQVARVPYFLQTESTNSSRALPRVRSDASDQDKWLSERSRSFRRVLST